MSCTCTCMYSQLGGKPSIGKWITLSSQCSRAGRYLHDCTPLYIITPVGLSECYDVLERMTSQVSTNEKMFAMGLNKIMYSIHTCMLSVYGPTICRRPLFPPSVAFHGAIACSMYITQT